MYATAKQNEYFTIDRDNLFVRIYDVIDYLFEYPIFEMRCEDGCLEEVSNTEIQVHTLSYIG